jgi:hypothetical protein
VFTGVISGATSETFAGPSEVDQVDLEEKKESPCDQCRLNPEENGSCKPLFLVEKLQVKIYRNRSFGTGCSKAAGQRMKTLLEMKVLHIVSASLLAE